MTTELDQDFDEFWAMTPTERKVDKKRARIAYSKARKIASKEEIHEGYARYRRATAHAPEWSKHPTTFLNGENWDDEAYRQPITRSVPRNAGDERIAAARAELARNALDQESSTRH